jgi:hypothetical protein
MDRRVAKVSRPKPPPGIAMLFADSPLVGDEKREDYEVLFYEIAAAAKPADAIAWLFVRDITDLSWEIRRERVSKQQILKTEYECQVRAALMPAPTISYELNFDWKPPEPDPEVEKVDREMEQWASDPKARRRIDKALAEQGYDAGYLSMRAMSEAGDRINMIDQRIASYEIRRMAALRAIERYSETLARRLDAASSKVIEGHFSRAAE